MPVVRTDGRAVGRCTVTWLPNFLGWVVYRIFLPMVLRFARESSAKTYFSRNSLPRPIFWQILEIFDFFNLHTPSWYLRTAALQDSRLKIPYFKDSPAFPVPRSSFSDSPIPPFSDSPIPRFSPIPYFKASHRRGAQSEYFKLNFFSHEGWEIVLRCVRRETLTLTFWPPLLSKRSLGISLLALLP